MHIYISPSFSANEMLMSYKCVQNSMITGLLMAKSNNECYILKHPISAYLYQLYFDDEKLLNDLTLLCLLLGILRSKRSLLISPITQSIYLKCN